MKEDEARKKSMVEGGSQNGERIGRKEKDKLKDE
jgi:hypothetical protein